MGKLFNEAQGEVDLSADILDYYADNADAFLAPEKLKIDEGEASSRTHRWSAVLRRTVELSLLPIGAGCRS